MSEKKYMTVKLVRSVHGRLEKHQACVRGLGLRKLNSTSRIEDTPATRGMVNKVSYMVRVVEEG